MTVSHKMCVKKVSQADWDCIVSIIIKLRIAIQPTGSQLSLHGENDFFVGLTMKR